MAYISVADAAKKWNLSERSVRNYCAIGKIPNAVLAGKTWQIPEDAEKPKRTNAKIENALLSVLREEKKKQRKGSQGRFTCSSRAEKKNGSARMRLTES